MRNQIDKHTAASPLRRRAKTKIPHSAPGLCPRSPEFLTQAGDRIQEYLDTLPQVLIDLTRIRAAEFLAFEPPENVSQRHRVFMAGLVELICNHLELPIPAWTEKGEFFLVAEWHVRGDSSSKEDSKDALDLAPPEFRRRKIFF